jgi:excisionase family DNA binding protein
VTTYDSLPPLLSVSRAAKILGLTRATAYRYAAAGHLPTERFGSRMYIVTARIRHLLDEPEVRAA